MGVRDKITASGMTLVQIAAKADVSLETVRRAKSEDEWPPQRKTRAALKRALGMLDEPQTVTEEMP
jgi:uncharacterized protein YjcR